MKPERRDPIEAVIRRLFGKRRFQWRRHGERTIGIWTTRDGGGLKLARGYPSKHRQPSGVRYNRFIRLRMRLKGYAV